MSVPNTPAVPPSAPPRLPRGQGLGGCLVVTLVVIGLVLILPGICSLAFLVGSGGGSIPGGIVALWMVTFVIAAVGIAVIRYAIKNR